MQRIGNKNLLIICGPTASGKSKLALEKAKQINGEIINIDAMQVYKEIPILTCSPTTEDKSSISHYLYNHISVIEKYSASIYLGEAVKVIKKITLAGKIPIIVGGTGLYIKALCQGLSEIPDIPLELRESVRKLFLEDGKEEFYKKLTILDPFSAQNLHPSNSQRLMRAYEVFLHTGKSIYEFHKSPAVSAIKDYNIETIILMPEKKELYNRCNTRFVELFKNGVVEEVESLKEIVDKEKIKAIGFCEIMRYIEGEITKEDAITIAQAKTRQYAKRQITWFRHQVECNPEVRET
jgi:tRNA dimethylallyltransferase